MTSQRSPEEIDYEAQLLQHLRAEGTPLGRDAADLIEALAREKDGWKGMAQDLREAYLRHASELADLRADVERLKAERDELAGRIANAIL